MLRVIYYHNPKAENGASQKTRTITTNQASERRITEPIEAADRALAKKSKKNPTTTTKKCGVNKNRGQDRAGTKKSRGVSLKKKVSKGPEIIILQAIGIRMPMARIRRRSQTKSLPARRTTKMRQNKRSRRTRRTKAKMAEHLQQQRCYSIPTLTSWHVYPMVCRHHTDVLLNY
jgi:hypothetical protein